MSEMKKDILSRVVIIYIGFIVFTAVIIGKIIYLQFFEADELINKIAVQTKKTITIEPNRGDICGSDGVSVLSTSVPFYEIRIDFKANGLTKEIFQKNIDSLSICLAELFQDQSKQDYKRNLLKACQRGERYYLLKRNVSYSQYKKLKTFPIFRLGKNSGGFIAIQSNKRVKPFSTLASRTIGYISYDGSEVKTGIVGLEKSYDAELRGKKGCRIMQRTVGNMWVPVYDINEIDPIDGNDVISTIDVNIQDVAEDALRRQLIQQNAQNGCAVLMEVKTGNIKAIVNLKKDTVSKSYIEEFNYAIGSATEPGSTFKLISYIIAFEDGFIDLNDTIDTKNGEWKIYDRTVKDSHEGGYGRISVQEAFEKSSNVAISRIITKYYKNREQRFIDKLYRMNLTEALGLDIPGEARPYIKNPKDTNWYGTTMAWMSFGYELKLTPLQILTFYNAIANNGVMVKPKFVEALRYRGKIVKTLETQIINPAVCSKSTIEKAQTMLKGVVENGTAKNLKSCVYSIAGKTGTAQIALARQGYKINSKATYQASFVGYFPADNPAYSCIVVVNAPSNNVYYGNVVAGTVFKEIADKVYATDLKFFIENEEKNKVIANSLPNLKNGNKSDIETVLNELHIKTNSEQLTSDWVMVSTAENTIEYKSYSINEKYVPNVLNMGAKDALFIMENAGLNVILVGKGRVVKQSLPAGTPLTKGTKIIIELG